MFSGKFAARVIGMCFSVYSINSYTQAAAARVIGMVPEIGLWLSFSQTIRFPGGMVRQIPHPYYFTAFLI